MAIRIRSLVKQFSHLYLNETLSDVTIVVNNVKLPAHRDVLSQRCQYFKTMFSSGLLESVSNTINIRETSIDGVKSVLKWIYTDKVDDFISMDHAIEVLRLAHMYEIQELVDGTVKYFKTNLNVTTVYPILNEAVLLSLDDELIDSVMDFVDRKPNKVLKHRTFANLSTDALNLMLNRGVLAGSKNLILNAVMAWMQANPSKSVDFPTILKNMPLGSLTPENLATIPSNVVDVRVLNSLTVEHLQNGPVHKLKNKNLAARNYGVQAITGGYASAFGIQNHIFFYDGSFIDFGRRFFLQLWELFVYFVQLLIFDGILKHKIGSTNGIVIDLGRRYLANFMKMTLADEQNKYYRIFVSDDGVTWDCVIDHSKYPCHDRQTLYFDTRPVRFIHIRGTAAVNANFQVSDVEVRYATEPYKVDVKTTLSLPSTDVILDNARILQGKAFDPTSNKITATGSLGNDEPGAGIILQLNQPYLMDSMKVSLHKSGRGDDLVFSYVVEVSVDFTTWTRVFSEDDVTSLREFRFERQPVVFVKFIAPYTPVNEQYVYAVVEGYSKGGS